MIDRTSATNIQSMLETIRAYQAQASGQTQKTEDTVAPKGTPSFTDSVKSLIEKVNDTQVQSTRLQGLSAWRRHSFDRCGLGHAKVIAVL